MNKITDREFRDWSNTWIDISRGFVEDIFDYDTIIHVGGKDVKGYWVYGYMVHVSDDKVYIYGGCTIEDIKKPKTQYEVIPVTATRCTGMFARTKTGIKPIFQYDIVDVIYHGKRYPELTVYWYAKKARWGMGDFNHHDDGGTYVMDTESTYKIIRTAFDKI